MANQAFNIPAPYDPIGAQYQLLAKRMMVPPSEAGQMPQLHLRPYHHYDGISSNGNLARIMNAQSREQGPDYLGAGVGIAQGAISAYRAPDTASSIAGAATGAANATGAAVPGWGGRVAQLAGLLTGAYGQDRAALARGQKIKDIYSIADPQQRQQAIEEAKAQGLIQP